MREIKFRGKSKDSGKFVYGDYTRLILGGNIHRYIKPLDDKIIEVEYNTIGEYTGLKDKNGKEIYEGDIVDSWADTNESYIRTVVKNENEPSLEFNPLSGYTLCNNNQHKFLVVGNIHN
jgi:uncharacterized phage protein (TIGR01671 family)